MKKGAREVPLPVVRRLAKYHTYMQRFCEDGREWVSSQELAEALGLTSSTVRQDLSHIDIAGVSKRGYAIELLANVLDRELGAQRECRAVVVGAGNLGRALTLNTEIREHGFDICGIFDSNPQEIGKHVGSLVTQGMETLPEFVRSERVDIGILTVPICAAQDVAEQLAVAGVKGVLNFVCAHIKVPESVALVDARLLENLQELAYMLHKDR